MSARRPTFVVVAALTLAVGIGANTSMVGVLHTVLFADLRFPDPDRILRLRDAQIEPGGATHSFNASARHATAMQERNTVFDGIVSLSAESLTLSDGPRPERVSVVSCTEGWTATLGVHPILGRPFAADEYFQGREGKVAQVSYGLWQRHFGGDPNVLGRSIRIGSDTFVVVGVLQRGFRFPYDADVWIPLRLNPQDALRDFAVFAHMRPRVTLRDVHADLGRIAASVRAEYADTTPGYAITAMTLRQNLTDNQEGAIVAVGCVMAFLLALASINVANLLFVNAVHRRKELAIRRALGASRLRQLRQLLTESLALSCVGCAGGIVLSAWFNRAAGLLVPSNISEQLGLGDAPLDLPLLCVACLLALAVGVTSGVVPALLGSRRDLALNLNEGGRSGDAAGGGGRGLLGGLVVSEVAVAFVLLAGAGLMMQNFVRLQGRGLGFEPRGLLSVKITPPWRNYGTAERRGGLVREILTKVEKLPGVVSAGVTTVNPLGGGTWTAPIVVDGLNTEAPQEPFSVNHRLVSAGLLAAMGIPIVRGRDFSPSDGPGSDPVVIVSARMAARYWPHGDALGKRLRIARAGAPWLRLIGVARDVRDAGDPGDPLETWYLPFDQQAGTRATEDIYLMVRSAADPLALVPPIEQVVWHLDPSLVPYDMGTMDSYYSHSLVRERLGARFMECFAAFGLLVAGLGIYGVMAFSVAQRTHEVGLRRALGAQTRDVLLLVIGSAMRPTAVGLAVGLAGAFTLNRLLASRLAEVRPTEWVVAGVAVVIFSVVAAMGAAIPARKAAAVEPMIALRND
jgi:predicted permease